MASLGINNTLFNNVSIMASSFHSIRTKGVIGTIRRFFSMRKRYGLGEKKMKQNLNRYMEILGENDIPLTLFVPALVLDKHSEFIKSLKSELLEIGLHGYVHTDYRELNKDEIRHHITSAKKIFEENMLDVEGFRAPYLAWNDMLIKELSRTISYDSSQSYDSGVLDSNRTNYDKYEMIREYYSPVDEPAITERNGVTMIPVWLPDDEILVDRFGMKDEQIGTYWVKMAKKAASKKAPLVIQLHPERIKYCQKALKRLIEFGISKGIRFLKLSEIKKEGTGRKDQFSIAITGDLDMISLRDKKKMDTEMKRMRGGL